MPPPLDLELPKPRRWPPLAVVASVVAHVLLFVFGAIEAWMPRIPIYPSPHPTSMLDTMPIVFLQPPRPKPEPQAEPEAPRRPAVPKGEDQIAAVPEPEPLPVPVDSGVQPPVSIPTPAPTPTPTPAAPPVGRIGPELADGKLWVRPLPLPPRELAKRLSRSHAELVDSAVTAIVQSFLDSVANDPASRGAPMPAWTTDIAGKKFGLDSNNLYVAGLKIPAAVLALLPIPAGNIDQNRAYNRMMELRADIQQAARRADNLAEFKDRIREIRLRKEREEEFERNQREAPDGGEPARPPRDSVARPARDQGGGGR